MEIFYWICVIVVGLCIGSFLNVCIYRLPAGESIVTGRSHCTACGTAIKPYDLVPVLSYVILRGRCKSCGAKISARYPLVELLNAAAYTAIYLIYGFHPEFFLYAAFCSALIVDTFIDIDTRTIFDRINLLIIIIGVFACFFSHNISVTDRVIGFFAVSLPLFIAMIVSKGGMGFGDVKLFAAAGLVLGYRLTLFSLLTACVIASVYGIIFIRVKGKNLKTAIQFGPFIAIGCFLSLLCGNQIIHAYLSMFFK